MHLRRKRTTIETAELDITSLMDILTILLVFLLKNFNASGVVVNVPAGIKLPYSESPSLNNPGLVIQVSNEKMWVENELLVDFQDPPPHLYDDGYRRIRPLFDTLVSKRKDLVALEKTVDNAKKFSGKVNLVLDKEINYAMIKRILHTASSAGYVTFQFIVLNKN